MSDKHWFNINTREQEQPNTPGKGKGGGRIIPQEVRRKMAKASSEGGRATCRCCGETFSLNYMRMCQIRTFVQDWACVDCKKAKGLQLVR